MKKQELVSRLKEDEEHFKRSAWKRGVFNYAVDLVDALPEGEYTRDNIMKALLNGADSWSDYSYGGSALIYDSDIAEALCTPSRLRQKKGGDLQPHLNVTWLDLQARALSQAAYIIQRRIPSVLSATLSLIHAGAR